MQRRNFVAAFVGALLAPLSFRRSKPAEASLGPLGCPEGARGKEGTAGEPWPVDYKNFDSTPPTKPNPWYKEVTQKQLDEQRGVAYDFYDRKPSDRLVPVDHSLLRWEGPQGDRKYCRAPWITLEHWDGEGDCNSPGKLTIDQLTPCCAVELDVFGSEDRRYPIDPQMAKVLSFDLADPYQLLLADVLVRGLIDAGVIENEAFLRSWQQAVIDSQNFQYAEKTKEIDPDAPLEFVTGNLGREIAKGHRPPSGPPVGVSSVVHTRPPGAVAMQLSEHQAAVKAQERRWREGPTFL